MYTYQGRLLVQAKPHVWQGSCHVRQLTWMLHKHMHFILDLQNFFSVEYSQYFLETNLLYHRSRGGQAQLFFESAIAIPQLEGSTCAIASPQLFKEMLLSNCNSASPQSQFFLKSATSSPQLGRNFRHIFGRGIW